MNEFSDNQAKAKKLREELAGYEEICAKEAEKNKHRVEFVRDLQLTKGERIYAEQFHGFHKCGRDGDMAGLRHYLEKVKVDINSRDSQGNTVIHCAASRGHTRALAWLFEKAPALFPEETSRLQVQPDLRNAREFTAMHSAAKEGHGEAVRCLYSHGFNPISKDIQGMTPAHWAAAGNHRGALEALHACQSPPFTLDNISTSSNLGLTPAHSAALQNCVDALEFLAEVGVDVNVQDNNGETPAHFAARMNWSESMDVFRRHGISMQILNSDDDTADDLSSDLIRHTLLWR